MNLDLEEIRRAFVRQVETWVDMMGGDERDRPMFGAADGSGELSAADILRHVKDERSEIGKAFLENMIGMSAAQTLMGPPVSARDFDVAANPAPSIGRTATVGGGGRPASSASAPNWRKGR